jgi:hypothetical protein
VLPTIVLGALPGGAGWSGRLARAGVDVTASGAAEDDRASLEQARAAAPHLALKARVADARVLDGPRGLVVETAGPVPEGLYRLGPGEEMVAPVTARLLVEDVMDVARSVLGVAREGVPSALWVAAGPGLDMLPDDLVEAKLAVLAEGARQARLYLAKEQFDI